MASTIQKIALSICTLDCRTFRIMRKNVPTDTRIRAIRRVIVIMPGSSISFSHTNRSNTLYSSSTAGPRIWAGFHTASPSDIPYICTRCLRSKPGSATTARSEKAMPPYSSPGGCPPLLTAGSQILPGAAPGKPPDQSSF